MASFAISVGEQQAQVNRQAGRGDQYEVEALFIQQHVNANVLLPVAEVSRGEIGSTYETTSLFVSSRARACTAWDSRNLEGE